MRSILSIAILAGVALAQDLSSLLTSNEDTTQLATLLGQYPGLLNQINNQPNLTILAPSNQALTIFLDTPFGASLATSDPGIFVAVLQYHILQGTYPGSALGEASIFLPTILGNESYTNVTPVQVVQAVSQDDDAEEADVRFISGLGQSSTVVRADVNYTNGIVHVIDTVLTIPADIVTTLVAGNLSSLAGVLNETDLLPTVNTLQDITVFAPNNAAFQSIGSALQNLTTDDISDILLYHVVNGTVGYSSMLEDGMNLTTANGEDLTIHIEGDSVFVNGAEVVQADILVANGVVHVIDNVLNPESPTASPSASATSGMPNFSGASSATEPPYTSGVPSPTTTLGGGADEPADTGSGGADASPTDTEGAAMPIRTQAVGVIGAAALFGAGVAFMGV
ncbi:Fasciclin-domain-containing protein [Aulographum hederae CBS 113979]|uniref:Fasciclin-domain-containing protein n=1 Tax=Aulographum hederae CBS 113979 TaxID=1176131 RepID=A0A6G1H6K4_9PEZI|nr:Fasciclin-domain-containing protein [Aulographum hederae CBS 113979]